MVKYNPWGMTCEFALKENHSDHKPDSDRCNHSELLYTATDIRKAFEQLADYMANTDIHCFCDVEVRKRSKQW